MPGSMFYTSPWGNTLNRALLRRPRSSDPRMPATKTMICPECSQQHVLIFVKSDLINPPDEIFIYLPTTTRTVELTEQGWWRQTDVTPKNFVIVKIVKSK